MVRIYHPVYAMATLDLASYSGVLYYNDVGEESLPSMLLAYELYLSLLSPFGEKM